MPDPAPDLISVMLPAATAARQRMMATSESQAAAEAETAPGVDKHHASRCRT